MDKHIMKLLKKKIAFVGSESDGQPHVKAMLASKREDNKIFYFNSNNDSQRTAQWQKNPKACIYFYSGIIYRGVMLSGNMEILNDMETKKQHWKRSLKSIYKNGITDPDYCILKFTANKDLYYSMLKSEDFKL
jgi:general stress protein 26